MNIVDALRLVWSSSSNLVNRLLTGNITETYTLNSTEVIDSKKARGIYHNIENEYKLSAGMAKPIINADVSFINEPLFHSDDKRTNLELMEINKNNVGFYQSSHMVALREGDVYVWVQWDDKINNVRWSSFPGDKLYEIIRDPVTNEAIQYVFKWHVNYKDTELADKQLTISVLIDKDVIVHKYSGDVPKGYENSVVPNVLKTLPVVQLSNEREDFEAKGHSEITPIEPYLKAYHDVMMMALQSQKNNSAPKMKFKVGNAKKFIDTNFGEGSYNDWVSGNKPEGFAVENLDLVFLQDNEEVEYMTVSSTTGSAEPLLNLLFYLIVETSETIEVVFGANLGTSLASVETQLPVYVKKVERKQKQFQKAWEKVVELTLRFKGFVNIDSFSDDIKVVWPTVDFETAKSKAETLSKLVNTHVAAIKGRLLSLEEAHEETKELFPNIVKEFKQHIDQVGETAILLEKWEQDAMSQEIDLELTEEEQSQIANVEEEDVD